MVSVMVTNIIFIILQLKTYVQNIISRVCEKICSIESVYSLHDDKRTSIYWRYMCILTITYFKCIILRTIYYFCLTLFDIHSDYIQVVKKIRGVDQYIVYDVSLENYSISKMIEHVNEYSNKKSRDINLGVSGIVRECSLIHNDTTTCLKKLFMKYATDENMKISLTNILRFNEINYNKNDQLNVVIIRDGKKIQMTRKLSDILQLSVYDIYTI